MPKYYVFRNNNKRIKKENCAKFSRVPNSNEISKYYTLDNLDLEFISKRRGHANKFGVALQLTCVRFLGSFHYRRRILTQLNRGESRHSVAKAICHGSLGEIRKRHKQGQENQLGALDLVTNALILWNTIYMEKSLEFLKTESVEINDKVLEKLSPLVFKHVNMLGYYSFDIEKKFANGKLRPLGNLN